MPRLLDGNLELQAILSCLQSPESIKSIFISKLTRSHFAFDLLVTCFDILSDLAKGAQGIPSLETFCQRPELNELTVEILRRRSLEAEDAPLDIITNESDANHVCSLLDSFYKLRRSRELVRGTAAKLADEKATNAEAVEQITASIETALFDLRSNPDEAKLYHYGQGYNAGDLIRKLLDPAQHVKLYPSCFNNFDVMAGGFGRTDLVILGSHAKGGKSIVALNILINQYMVEKMNVCYISLEMDEYEVRDRLVSRLSGVEYSLIRQSTYSPADAKRIQIAIDKFVAHGEKHNIKFDVLTPSTMSVSEFRLKFKNRGYHAFCIDYLNLMSITEKNRPDWERLSIICRELKQTTKAMDCLIISPTQMNEDGDVRYSKSMREHANIIWSWRIGEEERTNKMFKVNQLVTRSGPPDPFMLSMSFETMTVSDGPAQVPEPEKKFDKGDRKGKMSGS